MVYIDNQGRVLEARPWGINSIGDLFWGIINFFSLFFRTLINPDANKKGDGYATDYRSGMPASHEDCHINCLFVWLCSISTKMIVPSIPLLIIHLVATFDF